MKHAFYMKWKKIALVLTSVFWASCGDDSSSTSPVADSSTSTESSADTGISSSEATPTSSEESMPASSNEATPASSNSSSLGEKISCEDTTLFHRDTYYTDCTGTCPEYGVPYYEVPGVKCEDGKEYELETICPDYGIDMPCENTYIGEDGKRISEDEFKKIYSMAMPPAESSSSAPNAEESSSSVPEIVPLYGVEMPTDTLYGVYMPEEKKNID